MNRLLLICGFAVAVLSIAVVSADPPNEQSDTVTIPLDQIWAYQMPGTKDIRELEPEQKSEHLQSLSPNEQRELWAQCLWNSIALSLGADSSPHWPRKGQIARLGFAVSGSGREAIQATYDVLVKGEKPRQVFSSKSDIALVFFSYQTGAYVELQGVTRQSKLFTIQYRFIRPVSKIQAAYFALIPVGQLPIGHYKVVLNQQPTGQEFESGKYGPDDPKRVDKAIDDHWGHRFVCGDYSFDVTHDGPN